MDMMTISTSESDDRGGDGVVEPAADRQHVVLIGMPDVDRSKIGLALARELRRPFLNSDNSVGFGTDHREAVHEQAECAWFERVTSTNLPAVIAAPPAVLGDGVGTALWDSVWVVFLDAPPTMQADLARSARHDHERARRLSDFSYVCTNVDPGVAARVIARHWHRVHRS